jgi:HPr kinase/phosphorylase
MDTPQTARPGNTLHASCVALDGRGLLITGASGKGKSSLALVMMALGARLVADDATTVHARDGALWASCPASTRGRIEARGVGILAADPVDARIVAVADLDRAETERLPPQRIATVEGIELPVFLKGEGLLFAAALTQYLKGERCD